jgi:hypothetical protein
MNGYHGSIEEKNPAVFVAQLVLKCVKHAGA